MRIGVHSESVATDAVIYGEIVGGVLGREVDVATWLAHRGGVNNVFKDLHIALADFASKTLDLAVVALDNDEQIPHEADHGPEHVHPCRRCGLRARVAMELPALPRALAVVIAVPRPAIESWLLSARDAELIAPEELPTGDLKYRLYRSKGAGKARVLKTGVPLAHALGRDAAVRDRVARACPSFAHFLESLASSTRTD